MAPAVEKSFSRAAIAGCCERSIHSPVSISVGEGKSKFRNEGPSGQGRGPLPLNQTTCRNKRPVLLPLLLGRRVLGRGGPSIPRAVMQPKWGRGPAGRYTTTLINSPTAHSP